MSAADGFWSRARRHRSFVAGGALTGLLVATALLSFIWTPYGPTKMSLRYRLKLPSPEHWLGTDQYGRDILSIIMAGAQNSISVGVVSVSIGLLIGVTMGLLAAARRGWIEEVTMRASDFAFAFPAILLAIMLVAAIGPGSVNAIIAIGVFNIPIFARLTRGAAAAVWAREFVLAARAAGKGAARISFEHILPNITAVIVVQGTVQFAIAILAEAALSYLGLGAQPPAPSWGRMLSEAQTMIYINPMLAVYPGVAIAISVLGLNLLGDGLRDLIDPRLARQR